MSVMAQAIIETPRPSQTVGSREVEAFLIENPQVSGLLEESLARISEFFGEHAEAWTEVHHDPEDGSNELFLVIRTPLARGGDAVSGAAGRRLAVEHAV